MKECTCPSLTRKCTLTSGAWQFHNRSGTSMIAKEAFPTLSLLFTVGAANRIIIFLSLWCLTLPVTKKKIGTDRENVPSSSLLQSCSEQTDVKLVPAAGAASLEFDKVCAFLSALYRFCAKLF